VNSNRLPILALAFGAAVILIAAGIGIQHVAATANNGTVALTVVPSAATVTIDNTAKAKPGTISLSPGSHTFTVAQGGFATQSFTVNIMSKQQVAKSIVLTASSQAGRDYLANHLDQQQAGEAASGAAAAANTQVVSDNPLMNLLPYYGSDFTIGTGPKPEAPNDPTQVAIFIAADTQAGKEHALAWIKAHGYNPSAYEIVYEPRNSGQ
jgi:hypothetical protein